MPARPSTCWGCRTMAGTQTAIVTGGARGIGLGIAGSLAAEGYDVALLDLDGAAAEAEAGVLRARHEDIRAIGVGVDVTDRVAVDSSIARVMEEFGRIDLLVNNAGIVRDRRFSKMEEEDWDAVVATNLKSQFLTCKAVLPGMVERGYGRIVNISSRAWLGGFGQAN